MRRRQKADIFLPLLRRRFQEASESHHLRTAINSHRFRARWHFIHKTFFIRGHNRRVGCIRLDRRTADRWPGRTTRRKEVRGFHDYWFRRFSGAGVSVKRRCALQSGLNHRDQGIRRNKRLLQHAVRSNSLGFLLIERIKCAHQQDDRDMC